MKPCTVAKPPTRQASRLSCSCAHRHVFNVIRDAAVTTAVTQRSFSVLPSSPFSLPARFFSPPETGPFSAGEEHDTSEKWERIRDHTRSKVNQAISSPLFWNGLLVAALFCVTLLVSQKRPLSTGDKRGIVIVLNERKYSLFHWLLTT